MKVSVVGEEGVTTFTDLFSQKCWIMNISQFLLWLAVLGHWHSLKLVAARMVKRKQWINCVSQPQCFLPHPCGSRPHLTSDYSPSKLPIMKWEVTYKVPNFKIFIPISLLQTSKLCGILNFLFNDQWHNINESQLFCEHLHKKINQYSMRGNDMSLWNLFIYIS